MRTVRENDARAKRTCGARISVGDGKSRTIRPMRKTLAAAATIVALAAAAPSQAAPGAGKPGETAAGIEARVDQALLQDAWAALATGQYTPPTGRSVVSLPHPGGVRADVSWTREPGTETRASSIGLVAYYDPGLAAKAFSELSAKAGDDPSVSLVKGTLVYDLGSGSATTRLAGRAIITTACTGGTGAKDIVACADSLGKAQAGVWAGLDPKPGKVEPEDAPILAQRKVVPVMLNAASAAAAAGTGKEFDLTAGKPRYTRLESGITTIVEITHEGVGAATSVPSAVMVQQWGGTKPTRRAWASLARAYMAGGSTMIYTTDDMLVLGVGTRNAPAITAWKNNGSFISGGTCTGTTGEVDRVALAQCAKDLAVAQGDAAAPLFKGL